MRALDDVVRAGKALYVAVSDTPSWVVSCMHHPTWKREANGTSMQLLL
jgi:aryl-alcohol dehydrogenase-like predicted oxidoreductase